MEKTKQIFFLINKSEIATHSIATPIRIRPWDYISFVNLSDSLCSTVSFLCGFIFCRQPNSLYFQFLNFSVIASQKRFSCYPFCFEAFFYPSYGFLGTGETLLFFRHAVGETPLARRNSL